MGHGTRLTVLGSLNMDISVTVRRLPEPGMTVLGGGAGYAPGGKGANQAVAAARLGGAVRMIGCVGDDDFGGRLRMALRDEGVADDDVRTVSGTPTGLAMITVDAAGENMITVAPGANRAAGPEEITAVRAAPADVLVISAEIPVAVIRAVLAGGGPALRVLNLAPAPPEAAELVAAGVDWLVVNESEAAAVLGGKSTGAESAGREVADGEAAGREAAARKVTGRESAGREVTDGETAAREAAAREAGRGELARETRETREAGRGGLAGETRETARDGLAGEAQPEERRLARAAAEAAELVAMGARNAVVTAGAAGAAYHGPGSDAVTVPGYKVRAVDSVGAGDTFVGALAVALAAGIPPREAVRAASAAGASATTRPGTQSAMPRPADILAATGLTWPAP